ncbi:MAG: hypothetical protein DI539_09825 [Flavobacterium psychrophilum]|nr:MAG: hypothetical protein DI539_09825 [Flavobacterium psychrophilum]
MDNMVYEIFIRRCWQCERFRHGADTDAWDTLLIKQYTFENRNVGNFQSSEKEFLKKLEDIKGHLDKAYNKLNAVAAKKKTISSEIADKIMQYQATVISSMSPKEIYSCLEATLRLMTENKLQTFK